MIFTLLAKQKLLFRCIVDLKQNLFLCSVKLIKYSDSVVTVVSCNPSVGSYLSFYSLHAQNNPYQPKLLLHSYQTNVPRESNYI